MQQQSEEQQLTTTKKHSHQSNKLTWIQLRTQQAVEYYSANKLQALKQARQTYLQTIIDRSKEHANQASVDNKKMNRKKRGKHLLATRKSERNVSRKSMRQMCLNESEQQFGSIEKAAKSQKDDESESCLSQIGKYELKQIHHCMLQFQKIIDHYLDYQISIRKKITIAKQQFSKYLKTTQYGYFSQKYLNYLSFYNKKLYAWQNQRILCTKMSAEVIEKRYQETKLLMGRRYSAEMMLLFN